ncbi:FG-GAP-like repeat-containing protein [Singulisphaera sp. Ch08]|uniref:FG-GAP-like repeat-containing protein n=1 Tax=Singulisphaera sp. Ch08 TaxID=3120278 RepID=A0AAU7CF70_9BACT
MRPFHPGWRLILSVSALSMALACSSESNDATPTKHTTGRSNDPIPGSQSAVVPSQDVIPTAHFEAVVREHLKGLGAMERYEYDAAVAAFREVHRLAPGWIAGSVNLAIALLNQTGNVVQGDQSTPERDHYQEALDLLDGVLKIAPANRHARYCRGIILEHLGRLGEAHQEFLFVAEHDPLDAHTWYKVGSTMTDPGDPDRPAGPEQAKALIPLYRKALELNPYLVSALYKLQTAYSWAGESAQQKEVLDLWKRLNPRNNVAGPGETSDTYYGEMGRYACIINPTETPRMASAPGTPPRFEPPQPIDVILPPGDRWVRSADFQGPMALVGRVRDRFGAAIASFDANGDGRSDLFLTASILGPKGIRDALLLNRGEGKFEDATAAFGLPIDRASLGAAAGDFDADRKIDLVLTGAGENRLYRNQGHRFEDVSTAAGLNGSDALSLSARWIDLDQDGDLDLYVINYSSVDDADSAFTGQSPAGAPNLVLRNDGKAAPVLGRPQDNWAPLALATDDLPATAGLSVAFSSWPDSEKLSGGRGRHTAVAALDLDDDRDIDLVLAADGAKPVALLNDRLGRFHETELQGSAYPGAINGLLVIDLDKDGRADLAVMDATATLQLWRNTTVRTGAGSRITWERWPTDASGWRSTTTADLDLDTWPDLIGLPAASERGGPAWARNDGHRLSTRPLALGPGTHPAMSLLGLALSDLIGDPLPDLFLCSDGEPPRLARNLGNGQHWLALDLAGRWKVQPAPMRSNPHGLGTRVALEGQGLSVSFDHTTREAGLAQSVGPVVLGLGPVPTTALLRLRWPDGTMQCELNVTADKPLKVVEHNRKTGSCPVLFTWNNEKFVCLGDFLGGGGLGYLVAPGITSAPDRDESVAISSEQLRPENGVYRLVVTEPMDECSYLDKITLSVVDRPSEVSVAPDERFAPEGPRPTGEVLAWRTTIEPVRATDLKGRDVTDRLRFWDRRTVDEFANLNGWIGYTETHGIVLDFGDRLRRFGKADPLVLCLAGWVEYPYSQTNYAAATAAVPLQPPSVERRREDGTWEVVELNAGYPAGLPRLTTLDLTGKLTGPSCVIRLKTNMECYWDQAFLAVTERDLPVRIQTLPVARAQLAERGYLREYSPDGRLPLLYDYDHVDPVPLARMEGQLTRLGDVASLLRTDDDHLCVIGPGDEVRLEFDAEHAPSLPEGWTRSYVLNAVGYCKDADPFTSSGDFVGPLPWRGMPSYPFGPEGMRSVDPAYRAYLREYQTRSARLP